MWNRLRKWLCKEFNLIGAETVVTVKFKGRIYFQSSLDLSKLIDDLKLHTPNPEFERIVTFEWKP